MLILQRHVLTDFTDSPFIVIIATGSSYCIYSAICQRHAAGAYLSYRYPTPSGVAQLHRGTVRDRLKLEPPCWPPCQMLFNNISC